MSDSEDHIPPVKFTPAQLLILDRHITTFIAADHKGRRKLRQALRKELQPLSVSVDKNDLYRVSVAMAFLSTRN